MKLIQEKYITNQTFIIKPNCNDIIDIIGSVDNYCQKNFRQKSSPRWIGLFFNQFAVPPDLMINMINK